MLNGIIAGLLSMAYIFLSIVCMFKMVDGSNMYIAGFVILQIAVFVVCTIPKPKPRGAIRNELMRHQQFK